MSARRKSEHSAASADASVGAALLRAVAALENRSETARLDAELLLAFATGRPRSSLIAAPERALDEDAAQRFAALVERRSRAEPLAYLTGEREFYSLPLIVSRDVLVPRPETELLVEVALGAIAGIERPAVLDVGTGSGAIALALKHARRDASVTATDASAAALAVARANAERLALDVSFVEAAWFERLDGRRYDVIASNPPYVRSADVRGALEWEPRAALDGGADGLDAYRALLRSAAEHLRTGAALLLEHGHDQRRALTELAAANGWRVAAAHDDLAGRARVLRLSRDA